jgi:serine/threonine protein phosphatase PrpC
MIIICKKKKYISLPEKRDHYSIKHILQALICIICDGIGYYFNHNKFLKELIKSMNNWNNKQNIKFILFPLPESSL